MRHRLPRSPARRSLNNSRRRIAVITPYLPHSEIPHAGGRYLHKLTETLIDLGAQVDFFAPEWTNESALKELPSSRVHATRLSESRSWLARLNRRVLGGADRRIKLFEPTAVPMTHFPIAPRLEHLNILRKADVIDLQWPEYAHLAPLVRSLNPKCLLICTPHDVLSQRVGRAVAAEDTEQNRRHLRRAAKLEAKMVSQADEVVVFSQKDAALLGAINGRARLRVIDPPMPLIRASNNASSHHGNKVVFVGLLSRPENFEGVNWFLRNVWPLIRAERPTTTFEIVGTGLPHEIHAKWLQQTGVVLRGYVSDLNLVYSEAAVAVAPLFTGAGVKFKSLEAIVSGLPIVATEIGAEGIPHEWFLGVTEEPSTFAQSVLAGLVGGTEVDDLTLRAMEQARRVHHEDRFVDTVRELYMT
ncbi:glycosyltransferase [Ornithinimicrobium sp. W1679]|uniref:glycosyltransferase n=1 Tax=Ornithinimicrobium sp. W1679 TaxID=3418770 RepID=UPI003CEA610C